MDRYPGFFDALIDRKYPGGQHWNGLPCLDIDEIDEDSIVINCVTAANAWGVDQTLRERTPYVMHVFDLLALLCDNRQFDIDGLSPIIRDWMRFPTVFVENIAFFESFGNHFADEESASVYRDYLDARISGSILTMGRGKSFCDPATMYFQPFLPPLDDFVFLDVGAFDGQNSAAFLNRTRDTRSLCIEPDPDNVQAIKANLAGLEHRVLVEQVLLGDSTGEFDIEPSGSSTAKIDSATASSIRVAQRTLDALYDEHALGAEKVFLKMDVEGGEADILKGASAFLEGSNNVLALSCYHTSDDLVRLWPLIAEFAAGRAVYLRHLTTGACETVLFIV